jgi:hypothetical protein
MRFHTILWDSVNRASLAGAVLQYPPSLYSITKLFTAASASFTAGGPYELTLTAELENWCYTSLYCTRSFRASKGGATNRRYIGGLAYTGAVQNWYSRFTDPILNWDLVAGETLTLTFRNMVFIPLHWPNYPWTITTTVL